jgi:hypothetical protein
MYAGIIATHGALCVDAPKGWEDLTALDLLATVDNEAKIYALYAMLKEKEDSFRSGPPQDG